MSPSCPLGISCVGPARKSSLFGHIIRPLLTKLVQSRWLNIGVVDPFLRFAKMSLSQYPAILTSTWSITHIYMHNKNLLSLQCSRVHLTGNSPTHRLFYTIPVELNRRFTVWVNCKENSGLVNFVLESRLSFTNQFHLQKRLRRPETGIKDGFEEMENKFPRLLFQMFRCYRKFSAGTARNCRVPFTSQPDFPKTSCKYRVNNHSLLKLSSR